MAVSAKMSLKYLYALKTSNYGNFSSAFRPFTRLL